MNRIIITSIITLCLIACSGASPQLLLEDYKPPAEAGMSDTSTAQDTGIIQNSGDSGMDGDSSQTCVGETDDVICSRRATVCGIVVDSDRCNKERIVESCGVCGAGQFCNAGKCTTNPCVPASDKSLCATLGKECAVLPTVIDNCGAKRTPDCGACVAPKVCSNVPADSNKCCLPETDLEYCARTASTCATIDISDNCGVAKNAPCGVLLGMCDKGLTCAKGKCSCAGITCKKDFQCIADKCVNCGDGGPGCLP